jgi:hypothetical protein
MKVSVRRWQSIRRIEDFRPVLGDPARTALVWFGVTCLARIRHLLVPDAIHLADMIEAYAEGRLDRPSVHDVYTVFVQAHYTPRIVRSQDDTCDIDIGEFDSAGCEAVAFAASPVLVDLNDPDPDGFHSPRQLFVVAERMAALCCDVVMATIPDLPWE